MDEAIVFFAGSLFGVFMMLGLIVFIGQTNIMEDFAEVFCNKDNQRLISYESDNWDFKNITCGGVSQSNVIERNPDEKPVTKTFDILGKD